MDRIWGCDGVLLDEGEYVEGSPSGLHVRNYPNGLIKEKKIYRTPILFDHFIWDELGRPVYEGSYEEDLSFKEVTTLWPEGTCQIRKGTWNGSHICWE